MQPSTTLTIGLLALAAGIAVAAMVHGAGSFRWSGLYPWVLAPYLILATVFVLPWGRSASRAMAGSVAAALVCACSGYAYVEAMWVSRSSTSALVFVAAPPVLLGAGLLLWATTWTLLARFGARSPRRDAGDPP